MTFVSEPLDLPDTIFVLLRDLIHERTGLYYEPGKREMLAYKLSARAIECGCDSFLDYYYLLKYDANADREWVQVLDALAVPETFFWRESEQIEALVDFILPQYLKAKTGISTWSRPFRIWSAACSSGEEPLSIAIALQEGGWFDRMPIEIYATDASTRAIAQAKKGLYRERSFRTISPKLKSKYFTQTGHQWQIAPEIHRRIQWAVTNLLVPTQNWKFAGSDVIFCRNVFIYFSEDSIRKTVSFFFDRMPSPGYLSIGASESLLKLNTQFQFQEIGGAFVYLKH
jgi:chemotaxis protein methyltransferase CheR